MDLSSCRGLHTVKTDPVNLRVISKKETATLHEASPLLVKRPCNGCKIKKGKIKKQEERPVGAAKIE